MCIRDRTKIADRCFTRRAQDLRQPEPQRNGNHNSANRNQIFPRTTCHIRLPPIVPLSLYAGVGANGHVTNVRWLSLRVKRFRQINAMTIGVFKDRFSSAPGRIVSFPHDPSLMACGQELPKRAGERGRPAIQGYML